MSEQFVPCPFCKQYSHSIGEDQLAKAFMHFQSMYAHPLRGTPMGDNFDEQTRDAAQVLMAAARAASGILTEGGDVKQAPGDSLSSPTGEAGDAQPSSGPILPNKERP